MVRVRVTRKRRSPGVAPALAALVLVAGLGALPASALGDGSVSATINVGSSTLSLTVSPTSFDYCTTQNPLSFPNGTCTSSSNVTVTMGNVGGHVEVNGADAVPANGVGTSWTLCGGTAGAPSCTDTGGAPGADQYSEIDLVGNQVFLNGFLGNSPSCDLNFLGSDCVASPNQTESESFELIGPASSTTPASAFSTSITWTALP